MKTKKIFVKIGCFFSLFLAGCAGASGPGPRTWIDAPLDGSTLPLAPVVVRSHATSGTGTVSVALYVNGTQIRADNQVDPTNQLSEVSQVWQPDSPGEYALQVVAIDHEGNQGRSNTIRVRIGGEVVNPAPAEGGQAPETVEPAETNIPPEIEPATPTLTSAPSIPLFTFTTNANCRAGPGTVYEVDDSFLMDQSTQIDGRNGSEPRWWWVLRANGGHCWVSDATGKASGPTGGVQVVAAPPPPVVISPTDTSAPPPPPPPQSPPSAPGSLSVTNHVCASPTYSVTLGWQDLASNESGYRVYRDNTVIATLGANATSYTDIPPGSGPYAYKVEAFNNIGAASAITSDGGCIF